MRRGLPLAPSSLRIPGLLLGLVACVPPGLAGASPGASSGAAAKVVTLTADPTAEPTQTTGYSGGQTEIATLKAPCTGWVQPQHEQELVVRSPISWLRIFAVADQPTVLVIAAPSGEMWCSDRRNGAHAVIERAFAPGTYRIWVGSAEVGGTAPYTLTYTQRRDVEAAPRPKLALTVPDDLSQPVAVTGAAPAGLRAVVPDFVLHVSRDYENLQLLLLGADGDIDVASADEYARNPRPRMQRRQGRFAAGDWMVWVSTNDKPTVPWTVVAWDGLKTALEPTLRYGQPPADAELTQRFLVRFAPYFDTVRCDARANLATADVAHKLFTTLPRSFFVFATRPVSQRDELAPKPGEPLLVLRPFADDVVVLSSDGECYRTFPGNVATRAPSAFAIPPPRALQLVVTTAPGSGPPDDPFVAALAPDVAAAYRAKKRAAVACYDREWDKLDPDHRASRLAIVTSKDGDVAKVEDLATKFDRTVSARCDLPAFRRYRDGLEAKARADLGETRQRWRREVIKHLVELGFAEAATP